MDEYLKTDFDDMEYDDAVKNDKRSFCEFFIDRLKTKQMIAETIQQLSPQYEDSSSDRDLTAYFTGSIGPYPIVLCLKSIDEDGIVRGWYYYESKGPNMTLILVGPYDNGELILNEFERNGEQTGKFDGTLSNGQFYGTYYSYSNSREYSFRLNRY
jgi:hypothetical protein